MDVLEDAKTLLNIGDTSKDAVLNIYIRRAVPLIQNYLNLETQPITTTDYWTGVTTTIQPVDVVATYPDAVIEYTIECYKKRGNEGIKQSSQGSRSQTYDDTLSEAVRALLPVPYVRMQRAGNRYDY